VSSPEIARAARARWYYRDPDAPEPNHRRTLSVIALIQRSGEVLLERRRDAPVWSFIAGMVRDTESLADALRREVLEETGLVVARFSLFGTFTDPSRIVSYPDGNVYRVASFVYLVEVDALEGLAPSAESEELRFFPIEDIVLLHMPATQQPIVDCVLSNRAPPHLD